MLSGQETVRAYSTGPGTHMGHSNMISLIMFGWKGTSDSGGSQCNAAKQRQVCKSTTQGKKVCYR